jgi:hypothetical protein
MLRKFMATLIVAASLYCLSAGFGSDIASAEPNSNSTSAPAPQKYAPTPDNPETGVVAIPGIDTPPKTVTLDRQSYEEYVYVNDLKTEVLILALVTLFFMGVVGIVFIVFNIIDTRRSKLRYKVLSE